MAHEITGRYAIVDGARAYYDVCGSGIPLVCIHMGWAARCSGITSCRSWPRRASR